MFCVCERIKRMLKIQTAVSRLIRKEKKEKIYHGKTKKETKQEFF